MTALRISMAYLDISAPASTQVDRRPMNIPAHNMTVEINTQGFRIWDEHCGISGGDYFVYQDHNGYHRPVTEMPHLDETLKAIASEYAANRTNPLGAFLATAVNAIEDAVAQRDGSSVYFAAAGNRIKIGWSRKVGTRIAQLQTGNPEPVTLLATMPGGLTRERELHKRFAHARLSGEWFEATPDLVEFINSLTATTSDTDA